MSVEQTISIIKPDAVGKNVIGKIYDRFERSELKIVAAKMMHLSQEQAEGFYAVHKERPFFNDLVSFMTSGPVMIQVLEGENACQRKTVSLWVQLILLMLMLELFELTLQIASMQMRYMVLIHLRMLKLKLISFLNLKKFAQDNTRLPQRFDPSKNLKTQSHWFIRLCA